MAYDEDLAARLRELLAGEDAITEKRMFGGLAVLLHGHMTVAASGQGGLLVRIDPRDTDDALARPHTSPMEMRGRALEGWIRVAPEGVRTKRSLTPWVRRSLAFAHTLPPKQPAGRARQPRSR
jgi:TfoX/Sxy family transcriptional regulator of competence genes